MTAVSVMLAVLAAGSNALSSVLQRKANRQERSRRFGVRLLLQLVRRPAWLWGAIAMVASFLLQAAALSVGALALVEPVLVVELPLTLILGSLILTQALHPRDWATSAVMAGGLALTVAVLAPADGDVSAVSLPERLMAAGATVVGIGVLGVAARFGPSRSRAALFGAAAGAGFGLAASLIKVATAELQAHGVAGLLTAWETYGLVAAGIGSVVLVQAALHAGGLVAAQPGITLLDPLVSVLWGVLVLGETTRTGPILIVAGVGAAVTVAGVLVLTRALQTSHDREATADSSRYR